MTTACRDCRHVIAHADNDHGCGHPQAQTEINDWFNGTKRMISAPLWHMRGSGACGPEGKLFEPAETGLGPHASTTT